MKGTLVTAISAASLSLCLAVAVGDDIVTVRHNARSQTAERLVEIGAALAIETGTEIEN